MSATATKFAPSKVPGEPATPIINITEHQAEMARRQDEIDASREEMLKCCNPVYARQRELEKPQHTWTIEVEWYRVHPTKGMVNYHKKQGVIAQSEGDAWAKFCDRLGEWPSRRDAKISIKRGKQLSQSQVAAESTTTVDTGIPRVEFKSKEELNWVEV